MKNWFISLSDFHVINFDAFRPKFDQIPQNFSLVLMEKTHDKNCVTYDSAEYLIRFSLSHTGQLLSILSSHVCAIFIHRMAEAHHATTYSVSLTHEHHKIKGRAQWGRKLAKLHNKLLNFIYPAHVEGLVLVVSIVTSLYFGKRRLVVALVDRVIQLLPGWANLKQLRWLP